VDRRTSLEALEVEAIARAEIGLAEVLRYSAISRGVELDALLGVVGRLLGGRKLLWCGGIHLRKFNQICAK
jgi:hypothetical protein